MSYRQKLLWQAGKHPTSEMTKGPKSSCRSRYIDPSHPASSGNPISLITGGHINPRSLGARRGGRWIRGSRDGSRGSLGGGVEALLGTAINGQGNITGDREVLGRSASGKRTVRDVRDASENICVQLQGHSAEFNNGTAGQMRQGKTGLGGLPAPQKMITRILNKVSRLLPLKDICSRSLLGCSIPHHSPYAHR